MEKEEFTATVVVESVTNVDEHKTEEVDANEDEFEEDEDI